MQKRKNRKKKSSNDDSSRREALTSAPRKAAVLSMGCPRGVGPEICLQTAFSRGAPPTVIVGNRGVLTAAARALGLSPTRVENMATFEPSSDPAVVAPKGPALWEVGPRLSTAARRWGHPDSTDGEAQLTYVEQGYRLAKMQDWPLVTAPVSKEVVARCGLARAKRFRGHTEWLEELDGARHSVMCFSSPRLTCSLVTTHVPIVELSRRLTSESVTKAICELADLLIRCGRRSATPSGRAASGKRGVTYERAVTTERAPRLAVCSFNPHGGEGELLGKEEGSKIVPGIRAASRILGKRALLVGPVGAETAFRKAVGGAFDGVVAIYHDQATIPMKLIDFGGSVNVTQGLSIVRTSVDHGTAYDIAGKGIAEPDAMKAATELGMVLGEQERRIAHGTW